MYHGQPRNESKRTAQQREERDGKGVEEKEEEKEESLAQIKLDPRVQEFVKLIFDVSMMKKAMEKQHINLQKMPLGCVVARIEPLCGCGLVL